MTLICTVRKFMRAAIALLVFSFFICSNESTIAAIRHLERPRSTSYQTSRPSEASVFEDIVSGRVELLDRYLQQGGSPNRFLHAAVNAGSLDAVKMMLDRGAKVDLPGEDGLTPLMVAARHTYRVGVEMIQLLLDRGANVNARANRGSTPLMFACACPAQHYEDSYVEVVRRLIKRGAKVNVKNQQRLTPLKIAKHGRWAKITAVLKQAGARS